MKNTTPTCTLATSTTLGNIRPIAVTDAADSMMPTPTSATWTNWKVSFEIAVTNPSNYLGVNPSVSASVVNAVTGSVYAKTASAYSASVLGVSTDSTLVTASSTSSTSGDCTPLIAWGVNPLLAANIALGAAVFSEVLCIGAAGAVTGGVFSNCFNAFDAAD
jgi:hypothetical protein